MPDRDPNLPPLPRRVAADQSAPPPLLLGLTGAAAGPEPASAPGGPLPPGGGDPVRMLRQKLQELEQWAGDMLMILRTTLPSAQPLLVPIAQAGKALEEQIRRLEQRVQGQAGAPVSAPAAENPAEGVPARPPR